MKRFLGLELCIVAFGLAACGDDAAPTCIDMCATEGVSTCAGDAIAVCERGADGCLARVDTTDCASSGQVCSIAGGGAACMTVCTDACSADGDTQCNGSVIETCAEGAEGCLVWESGTDCADTGEVCETAMGPAMCMATCMDNCARDGDIQCASDVVQTCSEDADGCLDWGDTVDCGSLGQVCDDSGAAPACIVPCADACPANGDQQCAADVLETCSVEASGCLEWMTTEDCAAGGQVCDDSGAAPMCMTPCTDDCTTDGAMTCEGSVITTCTAGADGCLDLVPGTDCFATDQYCDDSGSTPACAALPSGDSCAEAIPVQIDDSTTFTAQGDDFPADFTHQHQFDGSGCDPQTQDTAEVVFQMELAAGETALLRETGSMEVVLSIQPAACGDAATCAVTRDTNAGQGVRYTATNAETVFLVVEDWAVPGNGAQPPDYNILINRIAPENCADGLDNNFNGAVDCDDPGCFGDPVSCATEQNCTDGADNDLDGDADCADADCAAMVICLPAKGIYEDFDVAGGDAIDLEGHSVIFTPDTAAANGYTQSSVGGLTALPEAPGSSTAPSTLAPGNDGSARHDLSLATSVPFYGVSYDHLFVGSNGWISFTSAANPVPGTFDLFLVPTLGAFATDLDPASGGTVTVDEFGDRVVISFSDVVSAGTADTVTFQVILRTSGVVEVHYLNVGILDRNVLVGIANGSMIDVPPETDLVPPPPTINEVSYDQPGTDADEYVELTGAAGADLSPYTLVHYNGADGSILWEHALTGQTMPGTGFFVIGASGVPNVDMVIPDSIQNGPDSLVLYENWDSGTMTGDVVDALAYEVFGASEMPFGEGAPAEGAAFGNWNTTTGRYPDGNDSDDNATDFVVHWWATPGAPNTPASPAADRITGVGNGSDTFPVTVPDNDVLGVDLTIPNPSFLTGFITDVQVGVRIPHAARGELGVTLTSPAGTSVNLAAPSADTNADLMTVYDLATVPVETLDALNAEMLDGTNSGDWVLNVFDNAAGNTGEVTDFIVWVVTDTVAP